MTLDWSTLARRTQSVARAADQPAALASALDGARELGAAAAALWLFDRLTYRLDLVAEYGLDSADDQRPAWAGQFKVPLNAGGRLVGVAEFYAGDHDGFGDEHGSAFTVLAGALASVLHQVQMQEHLVQARQEAAARGAVDALDTIVQSLPQGVVLLDPEGRLLLANRPGQGYLDLLAERAEPDGPILALGEVCLADLIVEAQASGEDLARREIERHEPERTWHFELTLVRVCDEGVLVGTVLSLDDVSLRRQAEQRLFHDARLASVGRFASGLAHELNNPMMIVTGLAEMLCDAEDIPAERREMLEGVRQAALRAAGIVQALTAFVDTQDQATWGVLHLVDVLAQGLALSVTRCQAAGITVELDLERDLPPVFGDAGRLQQTVIDLVDNAEEAIIQSGRGSLISVRGRAVGQEVWVEVQDDGPGVPPEARSHLFELFFTTKGAHHGSGLGLAIAHRVAQDHHGAVHYEPVPGGGSLFRLRLPRHQWAQAGTVWE